MFILEFLLKAIAIICIILTAIITPILPFLFGAAFAYSAEKNKKDEENK